MLFLTEDNDFRGEDQEITLEVGVRLDTTQFDHSWLRMHRGHRATWLLPDPPLYLRMQEIVATTSQAGV